MGTGAKRRDGSIYSAPYQHQGTGTINTLVLALLSIIAELKQSVIFAMEEPEIALPPHTQKRIISSLRHKSAQAIFTSHSPFVLEEFEPAQVVVLKRTGGVMTGIPATYPPAVKPKAYRTEFRTRFCEALLARYVLVLEGRTEFDALPAAARRLGELEPSRFKSLENLGVAIVDARGDTNVAPLGGFFRSLGKVVFAVFDKQSPEALATIKASVHHPYESTSAGFEDLVLQGASEAALRGYAAGVVAASDWPQHLTALTPTVAMPLANLRAALSSYFSWAKGGGDAGDLLASCPTANDMPEYVRATLAAIKNVIEPPPPPPPPPPPLPPLLPALPPQVVGLAPLPEVSIAAAEPVPLATAYGKFQPSPPQPLP
nr:AAA family ATPase [Pseudomonas syringae]